MSSPIRSHVVAMVHHTLEKPVKTNRLKVYHVMVVYDASKPTQRPFSVIKTLMAANPHFAALAAEELVVRKDYTCIKVESALTGRIFRFDGESFYCSDTE